jgi:ribonuclease J
MNGLARAGAEVLHEEVAEVHASGHACAEELRTMLSLLRPKVLMPVHGEYRMLAAHARLACEAGMSDEQILIAENGSVIELTPKGAKIVDQVETGITLVDGLGVGDVADVALRDRRHLAEDGVLIVVTTLTSSDGNVVASPELIARGFGEQDALLEEVREEAVAILEELIAEEITEVKLLQEHLHDGIGQLVYDRTRRRPMILPVILEV